jgi:Fe-S-cluster containining protein
VNRSALETYKKLSEKVSDKFNDIYKKYQNHIACGRGCHQCCVRGLTVNDVEKAAIAEFLGEHPESRSLIKSQGHASHSPYCEMLLQDGSCGIYGARPLVCRSHGVPLNLVEQETSLKSDVLPIDVCPLNFSDDDGEKALKNLDQIHTINLTTLNTILGMINAQFRGDTKMVRYPLSVDSMLSHKP